MTRSSNVALHVLRFPARGSGRVAVVPCLWTRHASTQAATSLPSRTIAVLGGGLTGLTSALVLARKLPSDGRFRIVLVEKQERFGGWVQSDVLPLHDGDTNSKTVAVAEGGPRSIRPRGTSGMVMLDLIRSLGLAPRLLSVPKFAPAARNRFIYYPDRLHRLVSSLFGVPKALLTSPPLQGLVPSIAADFFTPAKAWDDQADESVDAFLTRRFGGRTDVPSNLVSAVLHGIYAGDSRQLSVRALMPFLVRAEQQHGGPIRSVLPKWLNSRHKTPSRAELQRREKEKRELREAEDRLGPMWQKWLRRTSVYSFPRGIQEITDAMAEELRQQPHVELHQGTGLQALEISSGSSGAMKLTLSDGTAIDAQRVISALPASSLASALHSSRSLSQIAELESLLQGIPFVTVAVINILIPSSALQAAGITGRLLPVEGFGFLIPRSTPNNADGILGVVFDSDTFPEQDRAAALGHTADEVGRSPSEGPSTKRFKHAKADTTKLTVMLGGHWFDKARQQQQSGTASASAFPDEADLRARALRSLRTHLGLPNEVLTHPDTRVIVRLQRDCIPQYVVGHVQRMKAIHHTLLSSSAGAGASDLAGKLVLAGASYTGVSVNDCVAGGDRVARAIAAEELGGAEGVCAQPLTGLEMYA
ncbi:hypothetical protein OC842_005035 [Tilletia horrida]|uniref:Protoporphyrinogen oxidase n=1 Tax=Tilletia horrida TaxID=155126 RepID=A0AAN6GAX0_9BASI|nr:hypothetical protein OC842_005035 [Tilletia horrida]